MSDVSNPFAASDDLGGGPGGRDFGPDTFDAPPLELGVLLTRAWEIMRDNLGTIIAVVAVQLGIQLVFTVVNQGVGVGQQVLIENDQPEAALALSLVSFVVQIVGAIVNLWIGLGAIRVFVNIVRGRTATVSMLFGEGRLLFPAIAIGIITGLGTALGLLLLIVPGIIVALGLQFANYLLVDQDADIATALTESWRMAWPEMLFLFAFALVVGLGAVLIAIFTCGLGLLVFAVYAPVLQALLYLSVKAKYDQQLAVDMGG